MFRAEGLGRLKVLRSSLLAHGWLLRLEGFDHSKPENPHTKPIRFSQIYQFNHPQLPEPFGKQSSTLHSVRGVGSQSCRWSSRYRFWGLGFRVGPGAILGLLTEEFGPHRPFFPELEAFDFGAPFVGPYLLEDEFLKVCVSEVEQVTFHNLICVRGVCLPCHTCHENLAAASSLLRPVAKQWHLHRQVDRLGEPFLTTRQR